MLYEAITISNKPGMMTSLTQLGNGFRESSTERVSQMEEVYETIESIYTYIDPKDVGAIGEAYRSIHYYVCKRLFSR